MMSLVSCKSVESNTSISSPSNEVVDVADVPETTESNMEEVDEPEPLAFTIPTYTGSKFTVINDNIPYFTDAEMTTTSYESYSSLDQLGRCGIVSACVGRDIMPTEERGAIGHVKPTGWRTVKYNGIVDGNYLYNRSHLIGFQLTGENDNVRNLITGTRFFNVEGMLPFENMVADYVKETNNHVMYRVTPYFIENNLLSHGVLMEAKSVEDNGDGVLFNVFVHNVQPGITLIYESGENYPDGSIAIEEPRTEPKPVVEPTPNPEVVVDSYSFVVNDKNGKIHKKDECSATREGSSSYMSNPVLFNTYEEAEAYSIDIAPGQKKRNCGNCW